MKIEDLSLLITRGRHEQSTWLFIVLTAAGQITAADDPVPALWPHQFHAILFMNYSGNLWMIDLWYDWTNGRNFNIIKEQLGGITYDLEWNNGTSFFYTLDESRSQLEVGILRPNWLDGAKYLGEQHVNGFLWEKVDFIWYYEDVATKTPVQWIFYTGREAHVMTYDVGAVLEDEKWQAPVYCFDKEKKKKKKGLAIEGALREFKGYKEKAAL